MGLYVQGKGRAWTIRWAKDRGKLGKDTRTIDKHGNEARELGFRPEMQAAEAKAHAKTLQAQTKIAYQLERRAALDKRMAAEALIVSAFLPPELVAEFEAKQLKGKRIKPPIWNTAKKIIAKLDQHPSKWFGEPWLIYDIFKEKGRSPDYCKRIIRTMNIWGWHFCMKMEKAWMAVPYPAGADLRAIEKAYYKRTKGGRKALPLSLSQLNAFKDKLEARHYNWLLISVLFGLRPREVDQLLRDDGSWYLGEQSGKTCLTVYQRKLEEEGIMPERCWKTIPCILPEQTAAIDVIKAREYKRPLVDTTLRIGERIKPYSGRKNFSNWMKGLGIEPECRQKWMGHLRPDTIDYNYDDPRIVSLPLKLR